MEPVPLEVWQRIDLEELLVVWQHSGEGEGIVAGKVVVVLQGHTLALVVEADCTDSHQIGKQPPWCSVMTLGLYSFQLVRAAAQLHIPVVDLAEDVLLSEVDILAQLA